MRRTRRIRVATALVTGVALGACLPGEPTGSAGVEASLLVRADLSATAAAIVVVELAAPDIPTRLVFNIPVVGRVASGTISVPAGANRTLTIRAFDAGGVETHSGSVTLDIRPGTNPAVSVVLTPLAGNQPIDVTLGSFAVTVTPAAATLTVGDTISLGAAVLDANGQPVTGPVGWASLDPTVAAVVSTGERTGRVTAVRAGQTTVVATYGGTAGPATITVAAREVTPTLQLVATGLSAPLYVTAPASDTGRLFVVEQPGLIHVIRNGTLLATPFLDIRSLVSFTGEQGLLGMAFDPSYSQNGWFFVDYTDVTGTIQVVRYSVSADPDLADLGSAQTILSVSHPTYANHNGGMVTFGPDGYLYIGTGDGGSPGDVAGNAQDSTRLLGKILRIDVSGGAPYTLPPTNPFIGRSGAPEVWAYGLRNPYRFSFDPQTGDLYLPDVGEDAWEEVNVQPSTSGGGENYGWSVMEGAHCFRPPSGCATAGLVVPVFEYAHGPADVNGCAIIGGYLYRGTRLPALAGRYFFGDLCAGWVKSFRLQNGSATDLVDYTSQLGLHPGLTSFGRDARGELYLTLQGGDVYRIAPN